MQLSAQVLTAPDDIAALILRYECHTATSDYFDANQTQKVILEIRDANDGVTCRDCRYAPEGRRHGQRRMARSRPGGRFVRSAPRVGSLSCIRRSGG